jgi:transketolase
VIHLPTLKPLDSGAALASAAKTGRIVTVEDHSVIGGLGGLVAETVCGQVNTRPARIGLQDKFGLSAPLAYQLEHFGITAANICAQAGELLEAERRIRTSHRSVGSVTMAAWPRIA